MKSPERVRDLGEVFTPAPVVEAMLDLLPASMWQPHPAATFLEPAAGDGNFLVAILKRKLAAISAAHEENRLSAGCGDAALELHGLEALASVYGVDVSPDNIVGGTPGHEVGARTRMLTEFQRWFEDETSKPLTSRSVLLASARWIVERNLLVANMLPFEPDGSPSPRDDLPLVEYDWDPASSRVTVTALTFGQIAAEAQPDERAPTLFDAVDTPGVSWTGPARCVRDAPIKAQVLDTCSGRNGRG